MKHKLLKLSAAAIVLAFGMTNAPAAVKAVTAATMKQPLKQVQVNCAAGKTIKLWTNYQNGNILPFHPKSKSKWNVVATKVDKKGRLWYQVGADEWLFAKDTKDLAVVKKPTKPAKSTDKAKLVDKSKAKKPKRVKQKPKAPTQPAPIQTSTVAAAPNTSAAKAVTNLAKAQVGKGYAWGAGGPDSFDCSGLVQYVFNQAASVNLPRVTTDQVKVGATVAMNELAPGDLLFWGSLTSPYHVAIYVGANQYVSAATPEQGVVLQTISSYFYPVTAKRVL